VGLNAGQWRFKDRADLNRHFFSQAGRFDRIAFRLNDPLCPEREASRKDNIRANRANRLFVSRHRNAWAYIRPACQKR